MSPVNASPLRLQPLLTSLLWKQGQPQHQKCCCRRLGRPPVAELDFELPYYSKFLLLAAYICSRNKPSLDRRVFDPASRAGKHGHLSHDRQV